MRIDIWSDVVCPWCYIGKRRFDRAISRLMTDIDDLPSRLDIVYRAYQLDPTAPIGQPSPVRDVYARKFGGPERADAIFEQMTATAAADGITFDFGRALRANTSLAHRLLWWAHETYGSSAQSHLKEQLMAAYFTHGRNLGDVATLIEIAFASLSESCHSETSGEISSDVSPVIRTAPSPAELEMVLTSDIGADAVRSDMEEAASNGITGVPTYVIDGQWAIPGAQDSDTFERVLRRALERRMMQDVQ